MTKLERLRKAMDVLETATTEYHWSTESKADSWRRDRYDALSKWQEARHLYIKELKTALKTIEG